MQIPGYIFLSLEMSVYLTFIDFRDINFNEWTSKTLSENPTEHLHKALKYLCKSDPFVLRNTWNHSEGQWDLVSELPVT